VKNAGHDARVRTTRHRTSARICADRHVGGRCRQLCDTQQFHVENEVGLGWNPGILGIVGGAATRAVRELVRDEKAALATDPDAFKTLIPAGNDPARALDESIGLTGLLLWFAVGAKFRLAGVIEHGRCGMVVGRVELAAIGGKPHSVSNFVDLVGLGNRAWTDLELLIFQGEGGPEDSSGGWNAGRELDARGGRGRGMGDRLGCGRGSGLRR
jgi:hypothetical protein